MANLSLHIIHENRIHAFFFLKKYSIKMKSHATWENSADHDQLHSDLHCFQKRIYPGLSRIMVGSNLIVWPK